MSLIFLAGASGVIGRRLAVLLRQDSFEVVGTTRSESKVASLLALNVTPVVVDAFDAASLSRAVGEARPEIVIHQLTDLPQKFDPAGMAAATERNARLRIEGTRNLIEAARAAGVRRVIAQSIAFAYAPGLGPRRESDPLDTTNPLLERTVEGVVALETLVTQTPGIDGIALRYGRLYGPGTWRERPVTPGSLHVDAAAQAARLAVTRGGPGVYNITEDDGAVSIEKARRELDFDPAFRIREPR